jgi:hypothetical protein
MHGPAELKLNELLAALPPDVLLSWQPHLESVDMPLGQVLYVSGDVPHHVFFPTTAIVSLLFVSESGSTSEIAVVGRDSLVGISIFMGGGSTPNRAVVQSIGRGFRLNSRMVREEFDLGGAAMHLLLRYTQALITQMAQTAVCNWHHSLDQQLCRWLRSVSCASSCNVGYWRLVVRSSPSEQLTHSPNQLESAVPTCRCAGEQTGQTRTRTIQDLSSISR